jgi:hypothetical protein
MSASHESLPAGEHGHDVRSEDDRVPVLRLVLVGVGALLVFFVGSFAAVEYLRMRQAERGPIAIPPEIGQSKIGLVEQQPFELSLRADRAKARQLERLGAVGWVDRKAGLAHIPIDVAMQLVVQGVRPAPVTGAPGALPGGGQP